MSMMMPQGPPPDLGGPTGGGPGPSPLLGPNGPLPPPSPSKPRSADDPKVVQLLKHALAAVNAAAIAEGDDADTAKIHKIAAMISAQIGAESDLKDQALGISPAQKMIRKKRQGM